MPSRIQNGMLTSMRDGRSSFKLMIYLGNITPEAGRFRICRGHTESLRPSCSRRARPAFLVRTCTIWADQKRGAGVAFARRCGSLPVYLDVLERMYPKVAQGGVIMFDKYANTM